MRIYKQDSGETVIDFEGLRLDLNGGSIKIDTDCYVKNVDAINFTTGFNINNSNVTLSGINLDGCHYYRKFFWRELWALIKRAYLPKASYVSTGILLDLSNPIKKGNHINQ